MPKNNRNHPEYQYLNLLQDILDNGAEKKDHNTGQGLKSVFGRQIRFDLSQGFPLLTTKKVYWHGVLHELFWFLKGNSNIQYLVKNNVHIWDDYPYQNYQKVVEDLVLPVMTKEEFVQKIIEDDKFAQKWGELPMIYGQQWRRWPGKDGREVDQLQWAIDQLKNFPQRKHCVVSVWNPEYLYDMALPGEALSFPLCHIMYHFNVSNGKLSCQLYQRSADMFLGVPFNIASYALLTIIVAHLIGLEPGDFVHTFGDAHIYDNHVDQVKEQMKREPKPFPKISIDPSATTLDNILPEHIKLENYDPHPLLRGDLTVAGGFQEKDRKGIYAKNTNKK